MRRLMADPAYIDSVLVSGAERAAAIADKTMDGVKDVVGFIRRK
jgi:tryptophanyl-tRNA synthetase